MGPQPVATQVYPPQPAQHYHHNQQQQQSIRQQQKEHHHSCSLHAHHRRKVQKLCKKKGSQVHFKGTNTLRTALGNPKDKDPQNNLTGIIYPYLFHINCPSAYIGESGRTLGERVKEHFKAPSPIHLHSTTTGHPMDPEQFNIVHKEVNSTLGPSRRPCSSMYRIPPSTGTLASTSYLTYGTTFSRHNPHSNASLPVFQLHPTQYNPFTPMVSPHTLLPLYILAGGTNIYVKYTHLSKTTPLHP